MSSATQSSKSNLIYLFAIGATGVATAVQFAVPSVAVYAGIIAAGGIAGMIVTRAGFGKATLAFLVSAAIAAVLYFTVVGKMLADAANAASAGEDAAVRAAVAASANEAGNAIGAFVAVIAFVQTFIPGLLGSGIGALVRPKQKGAAPQQHAMAA
jgi:hypothetical protein